MKNFPNYNLYLFSYGQLMPLFIFIFAQQISTNPRFFLGSSFFCHAFMSCFYVMFFSLSKRPPLQWTFLPLFYLCVGIMWISILLFATGKDCVCITLYSLDWTIPCNLTVPILCIIYICYYRYYIYLYIADATIVGT